MSDDAPCRVKTELMRSQVHVKHKGVPPKSKATFAPVNRHPKWPSESGTLIYSLKEPEKCLGQVKDASDHTLRFNSRFESGNLDFAFKLSDNCYKLVLESDPNKSGSCQWFYFQIRNVRKSAKYTFVISGFHKPNGVFSTGSKVFFFSEHQARESGVGWFRGGVNYQYGWSHRDGEERRCSLGFQMQFPFDDDVVYCSYGIPYTYSDLLDNIRSWVRIGKSLISVSCLCRSYGGRDCPLLTLTSQQSKVPKEYIVLTGRCHPGESNGSVVLHGLIDWLLSGCHNANYLLDHYIVKIVPMLCIDGVVEGNYRVCLCGSDLNRVWANPDPVKHPVVCATKQLVGELRPVLYIDFHGHSRMNGTFAYGCPFEEAEMKNHEKIFPKIIALLCEAFSFPKCTFSMPPGRLTASRCVFKLEMGLAQSYTIETSFGGITSGRLSTILYDEAIWKEIGAKIGDASYYLLNTETSRLKNMAERELKIRNGGGTIVDNSLKKSSSGRAPMNTLAMTRKSAIYSASFQVIGSRTRGISTYRSTDIL